MVKSCKPEDYPQFDKLSSEVIHEKVEKLKSWIWNDDSEIPKNKLYVSEDCILNIIDLVERRRVYFHVFHGIDMSEWNEAALYCFWIVKLHPFFEIPSQNIKTRSANEVNALIAARMLFNAVNRIRHNQGKERTKRMNAGNLIHSFRYRDISKEAIMVLFENLISV